MFEQSHLEDKPNKLGDWILRGGIGLVFLMFGWEKFPDQPGSQWVDLFQQIGAGQWFRYFTGVVEMLGGLLVLVPWTATAGLALLACTMGSAAMILICIVGRPGDSVFSAFFFLVLTLLCWRRWKG